MQWFSLSVVEVRKSRQRLTSTGGEYPMWMVTIAAGGRPVFCANKGCTYVGIVTAFRVQFRHHTGGMSLSMICGKLENVSGFLQLCSKPFCPVNGKIRRFLHEKRRRHIVGLTAPAARSLLGAFSQFVAGETNAHK